MTIFPRWFQIGFLTLAGAGFVHVLVTHYLLRTTLVDVCNIAQNEIAWMALSPPLRTDIEIEVPVNEWTDVRPLLERSNRATFLGWKGESWTYYCSLTIATETSDYPFLLELMTRPSMDGKIVFQLSRGTKGSQYVYDSYAGNALLDFLRESYPTACDS